MKRSRGNILETGGRAGRAAQTAALAFAGQLAFAQSGAFAQAPPAVGRPVDTAIALQGPATESMRHIEDFHTFILIIISLITVLVLALLVWVMVRYNRRANPEPRRFSHNVLVEVVWTVVPVLILVAIAVKSFPLLYAEERAPPAELTIKVIGNSWYWSYEYPDQGVAFDSNLLPQEEAAAKPGASYLLSVDEPLVVPAGKVVKVLVSSNDVIHSWAVQSFGVKEDAIPGRLNEGWFKVEQPGVYFGQCSELCGIRHAFMPIEVHAVTDAEFAAWVAAKGGSMKPAADTAPAEPAAPAAEPTQAAPAAPGAPPAAEPAR